MHVGRSIASLATAALLMLSAFGPGCSGVTRHASGDDGGGGATGDDMGAPANQMQKIVIAQGAPQDAPSRFNGADTPGLAPDVAYPPDGALIPPNLNELEVQWTPMGGADLFEVRFTSAAVDLRIYTPCNAAGSGCGLTPDEATWMFLTMAARGDTVQITVRGTSSGGGGGVGTSAARSLSFADEDLLGGLYYWAAASGGIYRYDFGRRGQKAEPFYTPTQAPGSMCVGCHALSRNGGRIAVGLNAPTPAPTLRLLDVATRKTLFDQGGGFGGGSNYEALTPDGSKVITTESSGLTVRDAQSGALIGNNPALANANMPDVSPDGKSVVFARDNGNCPLGFCVTLSTMGAGLFVASFDGMTFGQPKPIAPPTGQNNYYPSFSPDGQFVVYNRASGDSYDNMGAKVMIVPATGGAPIDLASVNAIAGNSWPKWAPFIHHFKGATIFWIAFSTRRSIGLRDNANAQVWMVPVDAGKLGAGADPGYPPFWLPFQDDATGNHIPQWVEKVARQPCSQIDGSGCMQGEMCENGECVPSIQ